MRGKYKQLDISGNCVAQVNGNKYSKAMELNDNDFPCVNKMSV